MNKKFCPSPSAASQIAKNMVIKEAEDRSKPTPTLSDFIVRKNLQNGSITVPTEQNKIRELVLSKKFKPTPWYNDPKRFMNK